MGNYKWTTDANPKLGANLPQSPDETSQAWADELQKHADDEDASVKYIILANKSQLILQDTNTGTTDTYRRK